ncbi:MAG: DEAD/DEAH box helicase, partial [Verrucomicrobia bacterium]
ELAVQVSEEVHKLACFKPGIRALPVYGGQSYERQFAGLKAGANIVIGTPGRVMDHMQRGTLRLDQIHTVILDEADEMLDMGFRDDIEALLKGVPDGRQTVLFSATIPRGIEDLIARYTKKPERLHIEASSLNVPTIEQVVFEVDRRWKFEALTRLLDLHDVTLGIVFANTQRDVIELADHLVGSGYSAECIHGGMPQAARERVMNRFRGGNIRLLVATDVAARGIDVDDVQVVFNFELPYDPEDYVHRIGRTGRAGRHGMAMSLAGGRELFLLRDIERLTRQRLRRGKIPSHGEIEDARLDQYRREIRGTLQAGDFRHYDHLVEALLEEGFDSLDVANAVIHHSLGRSRPAEGAEKKPKTLNPGATAPVAPVAGAAAPVPAAARPVVPARRPDAAPDRRPAAPAPGTPFRKAATPPKPSAPAVHVPIPGAPAVPAPIAPPAPPAPVAAVAAATASPVAETATPAPQAQSAPADPAAVAIKKAGPKPKPVEGEVTRLWMSVGEEDGITVQTAREFILGTTGEPESTVLGVDIRPRHTFVDVAAMRAAAMVAQMKRATLAGRRLKVKVA